MENMTEDRFEENSQTLVNEKDPAKVVSYMSAIIPADAPEESFTPEAVMDRLQESTLFDLVNLEYDDEKNCPAGIIRYDGELYKFHFEFTDFQMTEMFRISHHLDEENKQLLEKADSALSVSMYYGPDPLKSYHLQLKVLQTVYPDVIAVADYSAFTVYSPLWVRLAAQSTVPPSPDYLYSVHAIRDTDESKNVSEEDQQVWLHTHGLNRCGFTELEILDSTVKASQNHFTLLNGMARRAVSAGEMVDEGETMYLGQTEERVPVITTWLHWEKVIDSFPQNTLGGRKDRDNEDHNGNTGLMFLYLSQEDYDNKKVAPVTVIPEDDYENLMIMYSSAETERMSTVARERISYLEKGLQLEESSAIVKMGIPVDEELREEAGTDWEHIWFQVQSVEGDNITAELLQEPYYFKHIQPGDTVTLPVSDLTDWILYVGQTTIDPDRAYLLAKL